MKIFAPLWSKSIGSTNSPKCSAMGMGQFPICKLKWDLMRTSVTACTIDKIHFLPHLESFMWERKFEKNFFEKSHIQDTNGLLLIFKLPFPNRSYCNGVCKAALLRLLMFMNYLPERQHNFWILVLNWTFWIIMSSLKKALQGEMRKPFFTFYGQCPCFFTHNKAC